MTSVEIGSGDSPPKKNNKFSLLLVNIASQLTQNHVESICLFYDLTPQQADSIKSGNQLMMALKANEAITATNLDSLKDILENLQIGKAVKYINDYLLSTENQEDAHLERLAHMYYMKVTGNQPKDYKFSGLEGSKINVVLVGKTGNGKSSTGNLLLGDTGFKVSADFCPCTKTIEVAKYNHKPVKIDIVDTPGLHDPKDLNNDEKLREIAKTVLQFPEGVHVFLIVFRIDSRISKEDMKTFDDIEGMFGRDFYDFSILVFTHGQDMIKNHNSLRKLFTSSQTDQDPTRIFKERIRDRVLALENVECEETFRRLQQIKLQCAICEVVTCNKMKTYTNQLFKVVQELKVQEEHLMKVIPRFLSDIITNSSEDDLKSLKEKLQLNDNQMKDLVDKLNSPVSVTYDKSHIQEVVQQEIKNQWLLIEENLKLIDVKRKTKRLIDDEKRENDRQLVKSKIRRELFHQLGNLSIEDLEGMVNDPNSKGAVLLVSMKEKSGFEEKSGISDVDAIAKRVIYDNKEIIQSEIDSRNKEMHSMRQAKLQGMETIFRLKLRDHLVEMSKEQLEELKGNKELLDTKCFLEDMGPFYADCLAEFRRLVPGIVEDLFNTKVDSLIRDKEESVRGIFFTDLERILNEKLIQANLQQLKDFQGGKYPYICQLGIDYSNTGLNENQINDYISKYFKKQPELISKLHDTNELKELSIRKANFKAKMKSELETHIKDYLSSKSESQVKQIQKNLNKKLITTEIFKKVKPFLNEKLKEEGEEAFKLSDEEIKEHILSGIKLYNARLDKVQSTVKQTKKRKGCFPSEARITTKTSGSIPISFARIGDKVLTISPEGHKTFQDVFFIAHSDQNAQDNYFNITTSSNVTINLSSDHFLFEGNLENVKTAKEIKVGDIVFVLQNDIFVPDEVVSVKQHILNGAFCPFTLNGKVIVDCVVASCFTATFSPLISQNLLLPLRVLYSVMPLSLYKCLFQPSSIVYVLNLSRKAKSFIYSLLKL